MTHDLRKLPAFFTVKELAERWQVSGKTVRRLIARKEIPVHRIGSQIRLSADHILAHERASRD
jgi:excisionase family DNA binding protein